MAKEQRMIDANALMDKVDNSKYDNPHTNGRVKINHYNEHDHFLRMIFDAPTVDAVPVVHGRWEEAEDGDGVVCSVCREDFCNIIHEIERFNYCPNCGAKMDGDGNG